MTLVKLDQQLERYNSKQPHKLEKIRYEVMVTGQLANIKTLPGHFGYYKTMAKNYTLGKEKLNKILAGKNIRAANRYSQFYQILAVFISVKSWSLK